MNRESRLAGQSIQVELVSVTLPLSAWTLLASAAEVMSESVASRRAELRAVAGHIDSQVWAALAPGASAIHASRPDRIPRATCEHLCGIRGCISAHPDAECAKTDRGA